MDFEFANKVAKECLNHYRILPKKGKPIPGQEWTLLSAIIMSLDSKLTIIGMATGTKCLGCSGMSPKGDLVNDSHAEVLARRCFLRYVYDQIRLFKNTGLSDIIIKANKNNQFEINPKIQFHFYTSHVPCGDASIIPKFERELKKRKTNHTNNDRQKRTKIESEQYMEVEQNCCSTEFLKDNALGFLHKTEVSCSIIMKEAVQKHSCDEQNVKNCETASYNQCLNSSTTSIVKNQGDSSDNSEQLNKSEVEKSERGFGSDEDISACLGEVIDVHRTGAKCVSGEDSKLPGVQYHTLAAVRTKPGRGDPTLSVSCSDKLARWIACGLQGAMLSKLLTRPVLLDSVVVGGGGPYSHTALHRALIRRTNTSHCPHLLHSDLVFPDSRYSVDSTGKPCPSAILWSRVACRPLEVCVEGKRQGATKKCRDGGRLSVCKVELLRTFLSLTGDSHSGTSYRNIKASAVQYNNVWAKVKEVLGVWTTKPSLLEEFTIT